MRWSSQTQHAQHVGNEQLRGDILKHVIQAVIPANLLDEEHQISHQSDWAVRHRRTDGRFRADWTQDHRGHLRWNGPSWRRRVLGQGPDKGGSFGGYMARYIAKNIVAAGLADRCEVQLAYAIGVAEPVSVLVDTFGTGTIESAKLQALVRANFKLTPKGIIESLNLRRPIYKKTAAYGHFGRSDKDFTWEATDKAAALKAGAVAETAKA